MAPPLRDGKPRDARKGLRMTSDLLKQITVFGKTKLQKGANDTILYLCRKSLGLPQPKSVPSPNSHKGGRKSDPDKKKKGKLAIAKPKAKKPLKVAAPKATKAVAPAKGKKIKVAAPKKAAVPAKPVAKAKVKAAVARPIAKAPIKSAAPPKVRKAKPPAVAKKKPLADVGFEPGDNDLDVTTLDETGLSTALE